MLASSNEAAAAWASLLVSMCQGGVRRKGCRPLPAVMGFGRVQPGTDAGSDRQIGSFGQSVLSYLVPTIASVLDRSSQEAGHVVHSDQSAALMKSRPIGLPDVIGEVSIRPR